MPWHCASDIPAIAAAGLQARIIKHHQKTRLRRIMLIVFIARRRSWSALWLPCRRYRLCRDAPGQWGIASVLRAQGAALCSYLTNRK
jgi:hypothetical protein